LSVTKKYFFSFSIFFVIELFKHVFRSVLSDNLSKCYWFWACFLIKSGLCCLLTKCSKVIEILSIEIHRFKFDGLFRELIRCLFSILIFFFFNLGFRFFLDDWFGSNNMKNFTCFFLWHWFLLKFNLTNWWILINLR